MRHEKVLGIAVSRAHLDVAMGDAGGSTERFCNDEAGLDALIARLKDIKFKLALLETAGGLERPAARALRLAGYAVVVVTPCQTHAFAKAHDCLPDHGRIDAQTLAYFARAVVMSGHYRHLLAPLPDAEREALALLVARREQLKQMRAGERQRLSQAHQNQGRSIRTHILMLDAYIRDIDRQIGRQLDRHDQNRFILRLDLLRRSIKDVPSVPAPVVIKRVVPKETTLSGSGRLNLHVRPASRAAYKSLLASHVTAATRVATATAALS